MTTLASDFERAATDALLDVAEREADAIGKEFVRIAHENFGDYAAEHGYDIGFILREAEGPEVERRGDTVYISVEWPEGTAWFEYGVDEHKIEGNPLLSFVWEDPPAWVKEEFDQARGGGGQFQSGWRVFFTEVTHPGLPEARAIRDALDYIRFRLSGEINL